MVNQIKNYLPLRVSFPCPTDPSVSEDTFMFVKQHTATGAASSSSSKTLFIANTPSYPNVRTSIILKSLFERYGDVEKVTVARNPRKQFDEELNGGVSAVAEDMTAFMFKKEIRLLGGGAEQGEQNHGMTVNEFSWFDQGQFAHVIFTSSKVMKKVWSQLNGTKKKKKKNKSSSSSPFDDRIKFGKLEMQELEDVSYALYQKERKKIEQQSTDTAEEDIEKSDEEVHQEERSGGFSNLVQAKKGSIPSRESLKAVCDRIMEKYEEAEEEALQQQLAAKNQPDEDGFVTVSYSTNVGDIVDFEENGTLGSTGTAGGRRRKESMKRNRSSRKNVVKGSDELQDFYRFQLKETKKRGMEELKNRFQEDLKRVKKMKEDKMFRPF